MNKISASYQTKGGAMYRMRNTVLVKYGKFRDYYEILEKLHALASQRGWAETTYWVPLDGRDNEITTERRYATLDEWASENEAWHQDSEIMDLVRQASDLVEPGTSYTAIEEEAFQIA